MTESRTLSTSGLREGAPVEEIDTPALLLDLDALEANVASMAALLAGRRQRLRPHSKTHKSSTVAGMQRAAGAVGVCCAKLGEAEVLVQGGTADVLITTPLVGHLKLSRLRRLSERAHLTVVADRLAAIDELAQVMTGSTAPLRVVVEVDVGQRRCGVQPGPDAAVLAGHIARHSSLRFAGLQGYQGRLQLIPSVEARSAAVARALEELQATAEYVRRAGHHVETLTGGGSGSLMIDLALDGLDELQPGSYVFMDASYQGIEWDRSGVAPPFRQALHVLTSVISRPAPNRAVVDAGWKAVSCDAGPPVPADPELSFEFAGDEHGIIKRHDGRPVGLEPADRVMLVPSHCDTTVNLYDDYTAVRAGLLEDIWPVQARGQTS